jgi:hypothetical protein
MPLVHGRYPVSSAAQVTAGWQAGNAVSNAPYRSNLELTQFFGLGAQVDTASLGGTTTGVYVSTICPAMSVRSTRQSASPSVRPERQRRLTVMPRCIQAPQLPHHR